MDEEIKEREAEEEESFILNNNDMKNMKINIKDQYSTCKPEQTKQDDLLL
jgi:hypothetical protein